MPLTPCIDDPNRKSELSRRKKDPSSFGPTNLQSNSKDWTPNTLSSAKADNRRAKLKATEEAELKAAEEAKLKAVEEAKLKAAEEAKSQNK